ncbi:MAG: bifunctional riboflavin kinase/FAD synthetase [Candidatus Omnitrophota bacterium]|nr:bifunctional riboflavin kinase/FAD synthetase [Candidatus Omnitrophota bacterium]
MAVDDNMQVIKGLDKIKRKFKKPIVTIGTFDGVHIGHQKIITEVKKRAELTGGTSVVITFDLHPLRVINFEGSPPLLTSMEHKMKLLDDMGVKKCLLLKFKRDFFTLTPEEFVKKTLVESLKVNEIFLGNNYCFGRGKSGDIKLMQALAEKYSFYLHKMKLIKLNGNIVSSSLIRSFLKQGKLNQAARFLGRPFSILGQVVKGSKRGRLIGYPTANLKPYHEVIPPGGVYAVKVSLGRRLYNAIINIGSRPTFEFIDGENIEPIIEVHIFDFNSSLYGRELEVVFAGKIRNERRFSGKEELIRQIRLDEARARRLLDSPLHIFSTVVK